MAQEPQITDFRNDSRNGQKCKIRAVLVLLVTIWPTRVSKAKGLISLNEFIKLARVTFLKLLFYWSNSWIQRRKLKQELCEPVCLVLATVKPWGGIDILWVWIKKLFR